MRVLAIPEDFRKDQYILKPILSAMLSSLGKPRARVAVCRDPLLGGVEQALRWEMLEKILYRYRGMVDLIILCVDRDGKPGRRKQLDLLERRAASLLESQQKLFIAENAWQELEVWVLAGLDDLPVEWSWDEIRQEINPKERYFNPFVSQRGARKGAWWWAKALGARSSPSVQTNPQALSGRYLRPRNENSGMDRLMPCAGRP